MHANEFLRLFSQGSRRYHLVGNEQCGLVAGLDLEGRLYALWQGNVLHRVNPAAVLGQSTRECYLNPGGDGLWPAPEGSCLGYHYATGRWCVPPGLSGARYTLVSFAGGQAVIRAEIDLINARGIGVPVVFERRIKLCPADDGLEMQVTEALTYLGPQPLHAAQGLLVPWTLAQFDCGPGCEVVFPACPTGEIVDLYDPSEDQRWSDATLVHTRTEGNRRYQIGLGKKTPWIEFRDPRQGLCVRRTAEPLAKAWRYIDIGDRPVDRKPMKAGARFSVYNATNGFMEIEAAGGCPRRLEPGVTLTLTVHTRFSKTGAKNN
ncbi:MAG: hypothetical protein KKG09_04975 [Verrucomicrobia bacterium]|nr:hypothetical protein [Verrucomicrobiota bacterium]MBU4248517.1 hypothetical protein [Verrucomicrobiota bacterium]MBU4292149.1 hypothetical protein [Verrucomicrobiota bacterium]MBU4497338.1 hypothetical protein [Verrucomicrobiota bacterium]MCG2680270.1 hypothetical protein [Kiritimatiellia bacterium]